MSIGFKLVLSFVLVAGLGAVVGIYSLREGRRNIELSRMNLRLGEENARLGREGVQLSRYTAALIDRATLYGDIRKELMSSVITTEDLAANGDTDLEALKWNLQKDLIRNDEEVDAALLATPTPLLEWFESVQMLFVYNRKELRLRPEKLGRFLFGAKPGAVKAALEAKREADADAEAEEDDFDTSGGLFGGIVDEEEDDDDESPKEKVKRKKNHPAEKADAEASVSIAAFLQTESLGAQREAMEASRAKLAETEFAGLLDKYDRYDRAVAERLAAIREPYLALHEHAGRIGELWRQRHVDERGYDLMAQLRNLLDSHGRWVEGVQAAMLFDKPLAIELQAEQSPIGSWLPSNFCRTFRRQWPRFDEVLDKVEAHHARLHEAVDAIRAEEDWETRLRIYRERASPEIAAIDRLFVEIWKSEAERVMMQNKAKTVLVNAFLPAMETVEHRINAALETLADAEAAIRSEQLERQQRRRDQEANRVGREEEHLAAVRAQLRRQEEMQRLIRSSMAAAMAVAILLAVLVSYHMASRATKGVALAERVRRGDLSRRLPWLGSDEIGKLAAALNSMADGLEEKVSFAQAVAHGDLTRETSLASEDDTFGRAMREMRRELHRLVSRVSGTTREVASRSRFLDDSSKSLAGGATRQAASLEEIASAMAEIAAQVRSNADNANDANTIAAEARLAAENGSGQMETMLSAMGEIESSSRHIAEITEVIDDIASQTKLLALNATIEAARAGKHGKGFAVVAEEVKDLAQHTTRQAKAITKLVKTATAKIHNGTVCAQTTASGLQQILDSVIRVTGLVEGIALASREQAEGIDQVQSGLGEIDQVTQSTAESAEACAAAASELRRNVALLREILAHFRLDEEDAGAAGAEAELPDDGPDAGGSATDGHDDETYRTPTPDAGDAEADEGDSLPRPREVPALACATLEED